MGIGVSLTVVKFNWFFSFEPHPNTLSLAVTATEWVAPPHIDFILNPFSASTFRG